MPNEPPPLPPSGIDPWPHRLFWLVVGIVVLPVVAASFKGQLSEQSEWRFDKLPLGAIRHFRFQVRPLEWVEFRGVALQPAGQKP